MEREGDVNNYRNRIKRTIPCGYRRKIDRIQLSIWNRNDSYGYIKQKFTVLFGKPLVTRPKGRRGRVVNKFLYNGKKIQLVNYRIELNYYCSIIIHDPDDDIQIIIRDMLNFMTTDKDWFIDKTIRYDKCLVDNIKKQMFHISQIEFAFDLYPDNKDDLWLLRNSINNSLYFKRSRVNAFNHKETTCYQGNNGDIRKGSKGSRSYLKRENNESFYRIEAQCNKEYVNKLKIKLDNFPISPNIVDFFDFYEFRQGHDEQGLRNIMKELVKMISKKRSKKRKPIVKGSLQERVLFNAYFQTTFGENHKFIDDNIPVAGQISSFKKFLKDFGLNCPLGKFFPVADVIRFRDPKYHRGSLRVPQWITSAY